MMYDNKCSNRQTQILRQNYDFLNKGYVLGIKKSVSLGNADKINIGVDKITEVDSLIGNMDSILTEAK